MSMLQVDLRYEDRLEGLSNYTTWKERIKLVLQVNWIWGFVEKEINKPSDPKELEIWEDLDTKVRLIIIDGMKDPLIPHVFGKNNAHEMWMALQNLFQNKNENRVLVLEDKFKSIKMIMGEGTNSYLTRISQVRDELIVVGVKVLDAYMGRIALKGFTEEWKPFIKGIVSREKLPDWNRLWDDFIQEDLRDKDLHPSKKVDEDVALLAKMKCKWKDLSKIKCFHCGDMGHYVSKCLKKKGDDEKKKGKHTSVIDHQAKMEEEEDSLSLISHFSESTIKEDGWYVDSGVMKHMTGSQDVFETLAEWDSKLHMVLGDKSQLEI